MLESLLTEIVQLLDARFSNVLVRPSDLFCQSNDCLEDNEAILDVSIQAVDLNVTEQASRSYFVQTGTLTLSVNGVYRSLTGNSGAYKITEECQKELSGYRPESSDDYAFSLIGFVMTSSQLTEIFEDLKLVRWRQDFRVSITFEGTPK